MCIRDSSCTVASSSTVFLTKRLHRPISVDCSFVKNLSFLVYMASETEHLKERMHSLAISYSQTNLLKSILKVSNDRVEVEWVKEKSKSKVSVCKFAATLPHRYGKLTCHMGSHSVTCHPTEVRIPPLLPAKAGTRFNDPGGMQGWVDLCYIFLRESGNWTATCQSQVQRPTAEPPRKKKSWVSSEGGSRKGRRWD